MQFINIIVHSVQDMNYRVYLQEEFKLLGLDDCLKVKEMKLILKKNCFFLYLEISGNSW
jgi:hypothetical protein